MLAFKPNRFFNELERLSGYSQPTLRTTYWRAKKRGLIKEDTNSLPSLTIRGHLYVQPYVTKKLSHKGHLMVIFDIPETMRKSRRQFRLLLRKLEFQQVQKSVWITTFDHRTTIVSAVDELHLKDYVEIYEAARLHPR